MKEGLSNNIITPFTSTTKSKTGLGSNEGEELKTGYRVIHTLGDEEKSIPDQLEIS